MDEAVLRRLIAEGSRGGAGRRGGPADLPSAESLRALAAAFNSMVTLPEGGEFKGEEAAVAAFRAARDERAAPATGLRGRFARLARRLGRTRTGALGVVVAAVLGSGVAVASGGVFFLPREDPGGTSGTSPAPGTSPSPSFPAPNNPTAAESGTASPHPDSSGDPSRLAALCRSRLEERGGAPQKALVAAAGGRHRVDAYCAALLDTPTPPGKDGPGNGRGPGGDPGQGKGDNGRGNEGNGNGNGGGQDNGNSGNSGNQGNGNGGDQSGNQDNGNQGGGNQGNGQDNGNQGHSGQGNGGNQGSGNGGRDDGNGNGGNRGNGNQGDRGNANQGNGNQGNGNGNGHQDGGRARNAVQPGAPHHPHTPHGHGSRP
ncbi:MAG TPA: hypothetical protein VE546_19695 [Streptomyces sp.]|uniref:hypothetical protein n=1 Tax=Streptomyces sp. TaxID=1931 RepID=UPI002D4D26C8|nr:hypothetical protein [Streptomyces sp.]HZG05767.1 hypothetical protein [Streptomyces sp.]